jgi:hypothetical protein
MTQPTEDTPEQSAEQSAGTGPRRRVRLWVWVAAGVAVVLGALVAVLVATSGPDPMSQTEVMHRYADLVPNDHSATPATTDELAYKTCYALAHGVSIDQVITSFTKTVGARATEVARLMVEYKCPERLGAFK